MIADFNFAIQITMPIFCIIAFGIFFRKIGWLTEEFARIGSKLVFNVTLPCLLFVKIVRTDFSGELPLALVGYALIATVGVFVILDRGIAPRLKNPFDRGAFVQGAFRSNMGIIGLAYCLSAFGEGVVAIASIYLAVITILFNVLAVVTLTRHQQGGAQRNLTHLATEIFKNPLILVILLAMFISWNQLEVPDVVLNTGDYFSRMTLPLALLCAGATIRLQEFQTSRPLYLAVSGKLFFIPLLITLGGIALGLRGESLGVLYLMCSAPAAAASYPMAQAMGANHHLAAAIIAATSLGSLLSTTLGIFFLRVYNLI